MDDLDDLFGGGEGGGDLGTEGAEADVLDQIGDDGEADVGLDEGDADLAQGLTDVLVGDGALAAQGLEGTLEFVAEGLKHAAVSLAAGGGGAGRTNAGRRVLRLALRAAQGKRIHLVRGCMGGCWRGRCGGARWAGGAAGGADHREMGQDSGDAGQYACRVAGNARLVREYMDYLRVEKGVRPTTCEAYARDLEQFAEQVERRDALLMTAVENGREGLYGSAEGEPCGCAVGGAEAELPAGVLSLAAAGQEDGMRTRR